MKEWVEKATLELESIKTKLAEAMFAKEKEMGSLKEKAHVCIREGDRA